MQTSSGIGVGASGGKQSADQAQPQPTVVAAVNDFLFSRPFVNLVSAASSGAEFEDDEVFGSLSYSVGERLDLVSLSSRSFISVTIIAYT